MATENNGITVRSAEEADIPAISSLVLTSFRQFPLFNYLYSPLYDDINNAHDTVFFWSRRTLLDLLDPTANVLVAEVPKTLSVTTTCPVNADDPVELESWRMLDWVLKKGKLSQESRKSPDKVVVGFAIWKDRLGHSASPSEKASLPKADWISSLRSKCVETNRENSLLTDIDRAATFLNLQISFWSWIYQRRDIDPARYREYGEAEETLEEQLVHHDSFLYLSDALLKF
jgi:hypothetical protein